MEVSTDFYNRMAKRRSIRHFKTDVVAENILIDAIATAGTAPSGANLQPWHFALIQTSEMKLKIRNLAEIVERDFYEQKAPDEWLDALLPLGTGPVKSYLSEAPALIAVFSRPHFVTESREIRKTYYSIESTGIATGLLITSLHNAGVATLTHTPKPMFFLNKLLGLDSSYKPFMIVVAGYPELPVHLPNISRKALSEIMNRY